MAIKPVRPHALHLEALPWFSLPCRMKKQYGIQCVRQRPARGKDEKDEEESGNMPSSFMPCPDSASAAERRVIVRTGKMKITKESRNKRKMQKRGKSGITI